MGDDLQRKLRRRLEALLKRPDNQVCADCSRRGPRWASANLGTFFCIECSGIHRNLGVHISFVRSVNLDSWTVKQVEYMEEWGNARANAYYEAELPPNVHKPRDGDSVRVTERFIRDKYEHKKFIGREVPARTAREDPGRQEQNRQQSRASPAPNTYSKMVKMPTAAPSPSQAPAPEPSLIDFMDDPAPAPVAPPTSAAIAPQQDDMFGAFTAAPAASTSTDPFAPPVPPRPGTAPVAPTANQVHDPFATPAAPAVQQAHDPFATPAGTQGFSQQPPAAPSAQAKQVASNDAILSMYNAPQPSQAQNHSMSISNMGGFVPSAGPGPQGMPGMMPPQMAPQMAPQMGYPQHMPPQQMQPQMGYPPHMPPQQMQPQMGYPPHMPPQQMGYPPQGAPQNGQMGYPPNPQMMGQPGMAPHMGGYPQGGYLHAQGHGVGHQGTGMQMGMPGAPPTQALPVADQFSQFKQW